MSSIIALVIASTAAASAVPIWISPARIMELPTSGPAWDQVLSDAQNSLNPDLGDPGNDSDVHAYAKALVYVRTGEASYRDDVLAGIADAIGTEGGSVRYLGLGLLGYIIAGDLVGLPPALDADWRAYLAEVRFDDLGESRNLIEVHEERPNNWGTTAGASRLALALYIGDTEDFDRGVQVFTGYIDGSWPHDYGPDCWREGISPPQGINPVGHEWAGCLPDDQRRQGNDPGCPPDDVGCENYVRSNLAGLIAQALIIQRQTGLDTWAHEDAAIRRAYQFIADHGCGWPGDDEWQPWLVNWVYGTDFTAVEAPRHGKSMGYTDWTHGDGAPGGPFCGDGNIDPGETCENCPADVGPCASCASDVTGDGIVGIEDFLQVLDDWGPCQ